jgi:photosystem II stability/assembly factor-like uncharacterized protein
MALVTDETAGLARVDLPDATIQMLATTAQGNVLYAGATGITQDTDQQPSANLYRSLDNGRTWQIVGSGPNTAINALTVRPGSESILYAGSAGGPLGKSESLWRSEDNGQTWHRYNLNLPANPDRMLPPITALAADPRQPEVLYVGTDGQGVYRFEGNRLGYQLVGGQTLANGHVRDLVVGSAGQLYALTGGGLFVITGDVWQPVDSLPDFPISLIARADEPQTMLAGSASSGIYRSTDAGHTWDNRSAGLEIIPGTALRVTALAVEKQNQNSLVAATAYGVGSRIAPGHLYRSHNGGTDWVKVATLDSVVNNLTLNNGIVHAATELGMMRYEKRYRVNLQAATSDLPALTHPTGLQVLILVFTITLAGLVFLIPLERLRRRTWLK